MNLRSLAYSFLVSGLLAVGVSRSGAQVWIEVGDAGETVATHQDTVGTGSLSAISGSLQPTSPTADLYCISILDPLAFSASTIGNNFDTQLFLFHPNGVGIVGNDDTSPVTQSLLPVGDPRITVLSPGNYLLGISRWDYDPMDASNNEIFTDNFPGMQTPIAGRGPLDHWSGGTGSAGVYRILLTGAGFCDQAVPEPGAMALFGGMGIGGLGLFLRRRRS